MGVKTVYITLEPGKYPRVRKIAYSFKKYNFDFYALRPKFRVKLGKSKVARLISGLISYSFFMFQIFLAEADIYWVANCPDVWALPLILRRKKYILDYRSPWSFEVKQELGRGPWSFMAYIIEKTALKHANVITLPTSKLLENIEYLNKPTYVIPNYPVKDDFKPTVPREDFRRMHNVNKSVKVILFVGKLTRVEGVYIFPKIIKELVEAKEKIVFWIVGDGPLQPFVKSLERKYQKVIRFFGWQPYKQIPNFINAADICIVPRHESPYSHYYNEENVQKISEYMLFKKPIIACGIASSNEYLLVRENEIAKRIAKAIREEAHVPTPKSWEEHSEGKILETIKVALNQ